MTQTETRSKEELRERIAALRERLEHPPIFPTEVYTRIVGYYRSVAAWNKGKREEYNHRKMFQLEKTEGAEALITRPRKADSYLFFFRQTCPACPAMKARLETLDLKGVKLDVDSLEGLEAAVKYQIMVTPTVVLLDDQGRELMRLTDVRLWNEVFQVVSPV